jgi:uncharacterized protein (DUF1697 family)
MRTYAAFLRGVSSMNMSMPELKRCLEATGFAEVRTLLSSGNAVFGWPRGRPGSQAVSRKALEGRLEAALEKHFGQVFMTLVRSVEELRELIDSNPYGTFLLAPNTKRVVTFLRSKPKSRLRLPIELDGARILGVRGTEVFSAYIPGPRGPVFMKLIEKTFGEEVTTRTWDTVGKVVAKGMNEST